MPEHSVRLGMPKRSCSFAGEQRGEGQKKLVMEREGGGNVCQPQWNLSTSGWLNRLQV